jgi:hypothetical protein
MFRTWATGMNYLTDIELMTTNIIESARASIHKTGILESHWRRRGSTECGTNTFCWTPFGFGRIWQFIRKAVARSLAAVFLHKLVHRVSSGFASLYAFIGFC